ncbi:TatD family hydrolase [Rhodohalobacter sulfatireducens]|uniref:TatD family hydrolase n=1 Tax=Rhodohalobacter sulfatireducens TaxID=2911366 RepID=A0ABS9KG44_9BACT|nr:TatD family hydrolase [Rhodohalobacter sulfatireducens]MCG2589805.1 TatD family hydrolase [Rhodohalobacter sulfatireducens]MDR9367084.1 TatD family hydrolase [Balneolaceae bacterium]MDR9409655.1 TatD family hydrolase [Balneolaceae bacterium]
MSDDDMMFIDPHVHMISRTTDDYNAMRKAGVKAVIEPAFWVGQPRTNSGTMLDYFSWIVGWERFRASQFGIQHYCTIGLNAKEANNEALAEEAMDLIPRYAGKESVVAIGEIGYDDMTKLEEKYFIEQVQLAKKMDMLVLVHTPHRNKKEGTIRSMDICEAHGMDPSKVIIDHNNEETVKAVLDRGYWTAFTIYPGTKMGNERMVDIVKEYGTERIFIDSAADWGHSDPLGVPKTAKLMLERGISKEDVKKVTYQNALDAYGQSGRFNEEDWLNRPPIDQSQTFSGNTVLRGGHRPLTEEELDNPDEDDLIIE